MRKSYLSLFFGMMSLCGQAESITPAQAEAAARRFFLSDQSTLSTGAHAAPLRLVWQGPGRTSRATAEAPFYVFNRGENEGFVVIAGESSLHPVLAYAYRGSFRTEGMPDNLKDWANALSQSVEEMRLKNGETASADDLARWNEVENTVRGKEVWLETPDWNQTDPYNRKCPRFWDKFPAMTGCVATATSIVMGYHRWPDHGEGTLPGYQVEYDGQMIPDIPLTVNYNWKAMPYIDGRPFDREDQEQADAVSTLMFHVGVMAHANYGLDATAAWLDNVNSTLSKYMRYRQGTLFLHRKYFSPEVWDSLVRKEIDSNRPIIYEGFSNKVGHAYVVDGYQDQFLHINWGWGGGSNGYYRIDNLNPTGTSETDYTRNQGGIFHVQPLREGETVPNVTELTYARMDNEPTGLLLEGATLPVKAGQTFYVRAGRLLSFSNHKVTAEYRLVLTDAQGRVKQTFVTNTERDIMPGYGAFPLGFNRRSIEVTLDQDAQPGDRIRIIYCEEGTDTWHTLQSIEPEAKWELVLNEGTVTPTPDPGLEVTTVAGTNLEGKAAATFSAEKAMSPSDARVKAYAAEPFYEGLVVLRELKPKGGKLVIPAHTGVLLLTDQESTFQMEVSDGLPAEVPAGNLLRPTTSQGITVAPEVHAYRLKKSANENRFEPLSATDRTLPANEAYLQLKEASPYQSLRPALETSEEITGIDQVGTDAAAEGPCYDLSGRRLKSPEGLYIKDGRKLLKKSR